MRKKIIYLAVIFVSIVIQTSILPAFSSKPMITDNVVALVIAWSLIDGFSSFLVWTVVAGLFFDLLSYSEIGAHVIVFLFCVYMTSFISKRVSMEMKGTGAFLMALFVGIMGLVSRIAVVLLVSGGVRSIKDILPYFGGFWHVMVQTAMTVLSFFAWFWIIRRLKRYYALDKA